MEYNEFIKKYNFRNKNTAFARGSTALCYIIGEKSNMVYKEYEPNYIMPLTANKYCEIKELSNISLPHIITPEILVTSRDCFLGHVSKFIGGKVVGNIDVLIKLRDICEYIKELEDELKALSLQYGYNISDISGGNIILSNGIYLIDTDEYYRSNYAHLYSRNLHEFNSNFLMYMLGDLYFAYFNHNNNIFSTNSNLYELYETSVMFGLESLSKFLYEFIKYVENITEQKIETISDLRKSVFKSLKRA